MITASVVTFHTSYVDLKRLLDCVLHSSIDIFFIIDNSSNDSLREFASLSDKIVYIHSDNLGFGSGHNIAIRRSIELGAQYHAVINPDIYWEGDVAKLLAGFMDKQEDCGLVMPKVLYPNGRRLRSAPARQIPDGVCHLRLFPCGQDRYGLSFDGDAGR